MPAGVDDDKSALDASLESKKEQSYYYAHQKRDTGEEPAPPPVHEVMHKSKSQVMDQVEAIYSYQFMDDDKTAKVYIPLEGIGDLPDDLIETSFTEKSMTVDVRGVKPNKILRLAVSELDGEIEPSLCRHRKLPNKVVITLKKKPNENGHCSIWTNLKK